MITLETFLANCRAQPKIVSVTAEEPTSVMMAQFEKSFTLSQKPTLFKFVVESNNGTPQQVNIIVPYEIWSNIEHAPVDQLLMAANRFAVTNLPRLFFLKPDVVDSVELLGHEIDPIKAPSANLASLLSKLKQIDGVGATYAYKIVDPAILSKVGDTNAVYVLCTLQGIYGSRIDALNSLTKRYEDSYGVSLSSKIYDNVNNHESIVNSIKDEIAKKAR